ncbi:MAG: hypothetical protein IIB06_10665, partial [Bacteroidetes bacterium]|nr:hypothetical protein [Bacteroidota bacterium]
MKILGIHDGHNSSAAILKDGQIIEAIQEERIVREKNIGGWPKHALNKLNTENLDLIALATKKSAEGTNIINREFILNMYRRELKSSFGFKGFINLKKFYFRVRLHLIFKKITPSFLKKLRNQKYHKIRQNRTKQIKKLLKERKLNSPLVLVDHHTAHAATAYYSWGKLKEKILVLTNDGSGDGLCATVSIGENGQ